MTSMKDHPTLQSRTATPPPSERPEVLDASRLRQLVLDCGADDVGFVELERPGVAGDRGDILAALPRARALISFVVRMNRGPIRSPSRSIANLEFHHAGDETNEIARRIVAALEAQGVGAINPAMGFPMEMSRFPGKIWVISHKKVAEAAGLGVMGIHRNVIHPRFGSFILLGTVVVDAPISGSGRPLDSDPCFECKLCVAACPVGAIAGDGHFDFSACYTHNYREFMGGFTDWVEQVADSRGAQDYRDRVSDPETVSWWQSLSFGPNYKAAYCLAVCPAGEDVIGPYLRDRKEHLRTVVKPLQRKPELLYVLPGSDAEAHAAKRFPHKERRRVGNGIRPQSIAGFLSGLPVLFQRHQAKGLAATYHFTFTGAEPAEATVVIRDQTLRIERGRVGAADLHVTADSRTWLRFLAKQQGVVGALLRRKIRLRGSPKLLRAFARCFPR